MIQTDKTVVMTRQEMLFLRTIKNLYCEGGYEIYRKKENARDDVNQRHSHIASYDVEWLIYKAWVCNTLKGWVLRYRTIFITDE